ncbi:Aspartic peptidase domain superfamily [Arabidopsis thaliana x Arabidopsis arenosa]|uniref:Aspartic peptidase domain superfamily n=1 Tax=Arabidopsis thaliana x Arabidopsis arenosa TaxID=1240361 RepID=A0A8T1XTL4_9BRAS|nr:Aspartic peptidase domain superfamily [Arabidopsis thaliana x Arabidopsis arenosa]
MGDNNPEMEEEIQGADLPAANPPLHADRRTRLIGAYDTPQAHGNRSGIRAPTVENNNFEIKMSIINMVQGNKFHGLPVEDPLDHLDNFNDICDLSKINGVSEDAFKLRLFPFSLGDKAKQWEKSLPARSVTTWAECKKKFLEKFFSTSRTAKLRNDISSFSQKGNESFSEAWERFNSYTNKCPHHGFSDESLLSTLYRGVVPKIRMLLDTASNGNFLGKNIVEGFELVENLAQSDGNYGEDYDRVSRGSGDKEDQRNREMKALNEKLDKVLQATQKPLNYIGYSGGQQMMGEEAFLEGQEEVNYVAGQGYQGGYNPNFRNHPNFSYRNNNVENPQDQNYPAMKPQGQGFNQQGNFQPRPQFNQQGNFQPRHQFNQGNFQTGPQPYYQNQGQGSSSKPPIQEADTSALLQRLVTQMEEQKREKMELATQLKDMQDKFEHLSTQVYGQASSSKRPIGFLPGKPDPNPKEFCNAIFTNDLEKVDNIDYKGVKDDINVDENEKAIEEISRLLYGSNVESLASSNEKIESDTRENDVVTKRVEKEETTNIEPLPYEPPLPFPGRALTKAQKKVLSNFKANMSRVGAPLPNVSNLSQVLPQKEFIKAILANREKVEELMRVFDSPSASQAGPKSIPKLENPGKFTIPCSLGDLQLDNALCDSGASVNVMSVEMLKSIGVKDMKQPSSSIMFGDASLKYPLGLIEDYPLKVGDCIIPTDFMVVEMVQTHKLPLILGTPFLNTVGATIDFPNKRVILLHVNDKISYPIKPSSTKFCGTITNEDMKSKDELTNLKHHHEEFKVVNVEDKETLYFDEEILNGECLHSLFDEHEERGKEEEFGKTKKLLEKNKKKMKETNPPTLFNEPMTTSSMTLTPWRYVEGTIEYKVKFKGRSNPFATVKAILTPKFKDKGSKGVEDLMKEVLKLEFKDFPRTIKASPLTPQTKFRD